MAAWYLLTFDLGSERRKADHTRNFKGFHPFLIWQPWEISANENERLQSKGSAFFFSSSCLGATALDSCVEKTGRTNFRAPIGSFDSLETCNLSPIPIGGSRLLASKHEPKVKLDQASSLFAAQIFENVKPWKDDRQ